MGSGTSARPLTTPAEFLLAMVGDIRPLFQSVHISSFGTNPMSAPSDSQQTQSEHEIAPRHVRRLGVAQLRPCRRDADSMIPYAGWRG
jgi:hypothetical protein